MVQTKSTMLELNSKLPDFSVQDVRTGEPITPENFKDKKALLVIFLCRHCPFVKHIQNEIADLGRDYSGKDVALLAVSSNDASTHPDDSPEGLKEMAEELGLNFPLCFDESQVAAKSFTAACTPDFFLFDKDRKLVYRGQFDNARPGNEEPVTGSDVRNAIDAVLEDREVNPDQKPSIGCNIKWEKGNEPDYFSA